MKDIKYIIADNVKLYQKKQNLTQFELAEKAELSVDSIKRIEHGSRTMLLENFMRIADALDVPFSYLMYEDLNQIPITERILNILNNKGGKAAGVFITYAGRTVIWFGQALIASAKRTKRCIGILCAFLFFLLKQ